jgi:hypothetical protein
MALKTCRQFGGVRHEFVPELTRPRDEIAI